MSQLSILSFCKKRKVSDDEPAKDGNDSNENQASTSKATTEPPMHAQHSTAERKKTTAKKPARAKAMKQAEEFKEEWKLNRPWLKYVPGQGMFCLDCTHCKKQGAWSAKPCIRVREASVNEHEKCKDHKDSQLVIYTGKVCGNVAAALVDPKKINQDAMVQAFHCLYYLCKQSMAHTTNFEPLLDLVKLLGIDIKRRICKGNNAKYTTTTAIKEMLLCINEVIETDIINEVKDSETFALMFDETTDCATIEQMVIHTRYVNSNGELCVKFLKILDALENKKRAAAAAPDHADGNEESGSDDDNDIVMMEDNELDDRMIMITLNAAAISKKVTDFMDENTLDYGKLSGIGTDGASVMTGKENGAVKKIIDHQVEKQKHVTANPVKAVGHHCVAHKLNLAASHAGNLFPVIARFKKILQQLYAFYSRSAVRSKGLKAIQELLQDTLQETGKVPNPAPTRWLALGECAIKLRNILPSVLVSLEREGEERGDVKAVGLFHLMRKLDFVATLVLMCDVLPSINCLSLEFQQSKLDFARVNVTLKATMSSLKAKRDAAADNMTAQCKKVIDAMQTAGVEVKLQNKDKSLSENIAAFNDSTKVPFVDQIMSNLEARFTDSAVLASFTSLFSTHTVYTQQEEDPLKELRTAAGRLAEQFGLSKETVVLEVEYFIHYVHAATESQSFDSLINKLTSSELQQFPNLSKLARIYKVQPPHTADCERDFSRMGLIKTSIRNRVAQDTLDSLMRISLEGPPISSFPFERAVKLWASKKDRRYKVQLV